MYSLIQAVGSTSSAAQPFVAHVGSGGWGSNPTAGNLLVLVVHTYSNSVTVTGVTDDQSNSWAEVVTSPSGGITERVCIWAAENVNGGSTQITVTQSGSANRKWHVYEISGVSDYADLVAIVASQATNSSSPNLTLTSCPANSFVLGGISIQDQSFTVGSNYTQAYNGNNNYRQSGQYDADSGAAGNVAWDCTLGGSTNWTGAAVAFGEVPPSGPAPDAISADSATTQGALAGQPVPDPPSVLVVDDTDTPIEGVTVTFSVEAGGGSMNPADGEVVTDASGIATLTSWTTGGTPGENTVKCTYDGLITGDPVTFTAWSVAAPAGGGGGLINGGLVG